MKHYLLILFLISTLVFNAQKKVFTQKDSIRGGLTKERTWWDVIYYDLTLNVKIDEKKISGNNTIDFTVLKSDSVMQIDLQKPMKIEYVRFGNLNLKFNRYEDVYYIHFPFKLKKDRLHRIQIFYSGIPREAVRPPWDGGFVWSKDKNGKDFIATACQGIGASVWWPCKDHPYDEPDKGMTMKVSVPSDLIGVSNGRLKNVKRDEDFKVYTWKVENPINNYGVNINIGDYIRFGEVYKGERGELSCEYYVLRDNVDKAIEQFKQVPKMLEAFEYWLGPYPFYEDGFKIVEVPYLGMEHQSSVTYGNGYKNGYLGKDLSKTGWGLKFDFIIIHESAHEWFANSITNNDVSDMWLHEGLHVIQKAYI